VIFMVKEGLEEHAGSEHPGVVIDVKADEKKGKGVGQQGDDPALMYCCHVCRRRFGHSKSLGVHLRNAHHIELYAEIQSVGDRFRCGSCGYEGSSYESVRNHRSEHRPPTFTCSECGVIFMVKEGLEEHAGSEHPSVVIDVNVNIASKKTSLKRERETIVFVPQGLHACGVCGRSFSTSGQLGKHVARIHPELCKHRCDSCDLGFVSLAGLRIHIGRVHGSARKLNDVRIHRDAFHCLDCDYVGLTEEDLGIHQLEFHDESLDSSDDGEDEQPVKKCVVTREGPVKPPLLAGNPAKSPDNGVAHPHLPNPSPDQLSCGVCKKRFSHRALFLAHQCRPTPSSHSASDATESDE
jgi:transcription elongation factor Elf1